MIYKSIFNTFIFLLICNFTFSQPERWQQAVKYTMDVDFNTKRHQLSGRQILEFTNNSPDTLHKVFYHLYFNAFQPNSVMDVRSRTIADPDKRVGDRISKLKNGEQGFQKINSLMMNGQKVSYEIEGTILEVTLINPILPHSTATFEMDFLAQVPLQIRRSGRFNSEGIEYSMSQWYPKMCNYDYQGWHANPYVGREFYGIWGDFDVKITLPKRYIIGATGILQNTAEIGYGYDKQEPVNRADKQTWHFKAENVHDFVWAADPDYKQIVHKMADGNTIRCFFQPGEKTSENWEKLPIVMEEVFNFANKKFGKYPYSEYSFIQGGDGGMEYPMATLITGERTFVSLVGVAVHELMHSWYQMVLGSNEALYHWMDEGFTSYASNEIMNHLKSKKMIPGTPEDNPHLDEVKGYANFALSGKEEPLITHADHFITNTAYGVASYTKGEVLLEQLRYIIGESAFDKGMLAYYSTWKFKHPNPNDFFRVMEKTSGLELDWFKEYFVHTTHTIDYELESYKGKTITFKRIGMMPMPLDIYIKKKDGTEVRFYIPLDLMRGEKPNDRYFHDFKIQKDWPWTNPTYTLDTDIDENDVLSVNIDNSGRMADVDRTNNIYPKLAKLDEENK
ncbi:MAG TPA: M1 family metallopeptidase [Saprospiraceae bacterium]|nr:M1 family metallopeptidase [Saprospiraceae bacterium]